MILHDFFCDYDSHEAMYAREQFEECILIFSSNEEKDNFNNAEDEEKQIIEITEKLDGKNGGKLYEDEKREKERVIAELHQVKQLYGQAIDTNKQLREQIQLLHRNIDVYKNKLSGFEAKLRVTEQENVEIKSSFGYKLFGKK